VIGLPEVLAGVMFVALLLYAVLGGADFGGGIWDLLATGPRAREQRSLIERALAPVWEANHVWLILVIVILFTAFPAAFAAASVWLHIPLTLMLVGIVFRGSAFVFRKYDTKSDSVQQRWGRVFAVSSIVSPLFLGICLGAITSGRLGPPDPNGGFAASFVFTWLHPFPVLVGAFALALFAWLAAVYLTVEAPSEDLRNDFRKRGLAAGVASAALGLATAFGALLPELAHVREKLTGTWSLWVVVAGATAAWLASLHALWLRRYMRARWVTVALVTLVLGGWALGQYPFLISPTVTIRGAAAPAATLEPLAAVLSVGALVLFPSMVWLFRVFKREPAFAALEDDGGGDDSAGA
jgi:cytochrome bd ubiquinol oxidase subunit II